VQFHGKKSIKEEFAHLNKKIITFNAKLDKKLFIVFGIGRTPIDFRFNKLLDRLVLLK
jgi:hypothetical protein